MSGRKHRNKRKGSRVRTSKSDPVCAKSTTCYRTKTAIETVAQETREINRSIDDESWKNGTFPRGHEAVVPFGVRSRLTYPLLRLFLLKKSTPSTIETEDEDKEEDEDEGESVELDVRPRFIFVSSLCAICLEKSTLLCESCRMVSYCSTLHRTQGTAKHRNLCDALAAIRSLVEQMLSGESRVQLDAEQYRAYRVQLLTILESKVGRPLELWEREIVLYPRVCRTCRRFGDKLVRCTDCCMEYFCEEHRTKHVEWCEEYQVFRRYLFLQHRHGSVEPKIPNARRHTSTALANMNFDGVMREIYGNSTYYREMDCYTYSVLSHVSTIPLTTLYAMQTCCPSWQDKVEWTVHVIGAEFQFEGMNLHVWEKLFLHFLPNLKLLRLILVGPELRLPVGVPAKLLSQVKLCTRCKSNGRAVVVSFHPEKLYHEMTRDPSRRVDEPDLICAFNPGLYRKTGFAGKDTWFETMREFLKGVTPVVITAYTADEMLWELARVKSAADVEILMQPRRNPFASIKPDRNFVSDDTNPLIYKNYHVSIVGGKSALLL